MRSGGSRRQIPFEQRCAAFVGRAATGWSFGTGLHLTPVWRSVRSASPKLAKITTVPFSAVFQICVMSQWSIGGVDGFASAAITCRSLANWTPDCFQPAVKMAWARRKEHWRVVSRPISHSADHRPRCHWPWLLTLQPACRQSRSQGLEPTYTYAGKSVAHRANSSLRRFARQRAHSILARDTILLEVKKQPFIRQRAISALSRMADFCTARREQQF